MAVVKNLMVRAGADFSAITKQANKAKASMSGMQSSVSKSCTRMTSAVSGMNKAFAALGVTLSAAAIVTAAKGAKAAYDEQAEASAKLAQVMRNTMGARSAEIKSIGDLIDAQEKLGVVKGDVQTEGAQELATYLRLSSSLKTLIPVMNDMVAQQYGIGASAESAVSIATMMGKVMNGQTSALSRYGYSFTKAQEEILKYGTEAQRAAVLAEVVTESVGGMNAALAATPNGRLQQVSNTLGQIQESFGQAVNNIAVLFIPAMNVACSVLANLATLANKVAQALANVFGGTSTAAAATVGYTAAAASGMSDLAEESEAAGAAAKKLSTFGFDTLQKLSATSSGSGEAAAAEEPPAAGGAITETLDGSDAAGETIGWLEAGLNRLKKTAAALNFEPLAAAFGRLKNAAAPLTQGFFSGIQWAYTNVFEPLAHWSTEGLLPAFLDVLAGAASLLASAITALMPAGTWLWEKFLVPIASWSGGVIVSTLQSVADLLQKISDVISGNTSLGEFIASLTPAQTAILGIATALGTLKVAMGGLAAFATVSKALQASGIITFSKRLSEVFALVAGGAGTMSEAIAAVFGPGSILAGAASVLAGVAMAVTNFIGMLKNGFSWANEALMVLGTALAAVGAIILGAPALVAAAIAGVVAAIGTAVVVIKDNWTQISMAWNEAMTNLQTWGINAWTSIKNAWNGAKAWFSNNVTTPIANGFRTFVNTVIGFFEGLANGAINGINSIIRAFNRISFSIPDWVPGIGGKSWGFSLATYPNITLPRLANGAVFEGNNPYLAIVNDQKHGVNVESPLSTIVEAMMIALKSSNFADGIEVNVNAVFEGQLAALARLLRPYFEADAKRVGKQASTAKGVV